MVQKSVAPTPSTFILGVGATLFLHSLTLQGVNCLITRLCVVDNRAIFNLMSRSTHSKTTWLGRWTIYIVKKKHSMKH